MQYTHMCIGINNISTVITNETAMYACVSSFIEDEDVLILKKQVIFLGGGGSLLHEASLLNALCSII